MVVTKINFPYVYETAMYVREKFNASYFSATKASFPQNAISSFRSQMLDNSEFNSTLETLNQVKKEIGMRVDSAWVYSMCGFRDAEILEQFGFNRKCACGRYNFVIDANGNMKDCGCDSRTYGNILEDTFQNAISRMNGKAAYFCQENAKTAQIWCTAGVGAVPMHIAPLAIDAEWIRQPM